MAEPDITNVPVRDEDNEFLRYSGGSLGAQITTYQETPSLFSVIAEHFHLEELAKVLR